MSSFADATSVNSSRDSFIASESFAGARPGYIFKRDQMGVGYYRDKNNDDGIADRSKKKMKRSESDDVSKGTEQSAEQSKGDESLFSFAENNPPVKKVITLSVPGVKSGALSLEKGINANQLAREKFGDQPEKFIESEMALYDEIEGIKSVASSVELYPLLVSLGTYASLLGLITHENSDISCCAVSVFRELIDVDVFKEAAEDNDDSNGNTRPLILAEKIIEEGGLEIITVNLYRLDENEPEEATGIIDTLTLIESYLDIDASFPQIRKTIGNKSVALLLFETTTFVGYLLNRVANNKLPFNAVKQQCSEILSVLYGHEDIQTGISLARVRCHPTMKDCKRNAKDNTATLDGIENLLQTVGKYRKKDPATDEETEVSSLRLHEIVFFLRPKFQKLKHSNIQTQFLENIFDILAFSLIDNQSNTGSFLEGQGIELCFRCIKEKVHSGRGSLKVLSVLMDSAKNGREVAEAFVNAGGLKIVFPIFMGKPSAMPKPCENCSAGSALAKKSNSSDKKLSKLAREALKDRRDFFAGIERNAVDIVYLLTKHLTASSPNDALARVVAKFADSKDASKLDRAVELCLKFDESGRRKEIKYLRSEEAEVAAEEGGDEVVQYAALNARLEGGGEAYHKIGAVIGFLCVESKSCHEHIRGQLKTLGSGIGLIKDALKEYSALLEEGGGEKTRLEGIIDMI